MGARREDLNSVQGTGITSIPTLQRSINRTPEPGNQAAKSQTRQSPRT